MVTRLSVIAVSIAAVMSGYSMRRAPDERPAPSAALPLDPCFIDGLSEEVRCGTFEMKEDRGSDTSRRIRIQVSVVPALVRDRAPDPFVVLAGGPGQGARSYAPLVPRYFQRVRRTRDIVLVDLRGTGESAPLKCPTPPGVLELATSSEPPTQSAQRCLEGLSADPRFYTHRYALADLRDVLQQLGYDRVNLWGGSWGTRSALVFAATYPDMVRTAVLDGAVSATMDFPWSYGADAQRALERLWADCSRDDPCQRTFPDARREISEWLAGLDRHPLRVALRHPRSAQHVVVDLDRAAATELLRVALYSPLDASRLLMVIRQAATGDIAPLAAMAERMAGATIDTMALGQTMAILCSEDVGRHAAGSATDTLFRTYAADVWTARCGGWPKGPALAIGSDTKLSTPALILSGDLDPVTPPARGADMQRHFPNSLHVVAPGAGHNVSFSGCVPRLIADFVRDGAWQSLDASCAREIARPPFVTSSAGGRP
jgi:pimeloyl-ACP methyl ester carboxylesterase